VTRLLEIRSPQSGFLTSRGAASTDYGDVGDILDAGSMTLLTSAKFRQQRNQFQDLASGNRVTVPQFVVGL